VAIAEQGFDLDRFLEFVVAETERLHPGSNGISKKAPRIFTAKYLGVPWMPRGRSRPEIRPASVFLMTPGAMLSGRRPADPP
jgi:hypothetical protein